MTWINIFKRKEKNEWYDEYRDLNLCNGEIRFILEDDEDMVEILYDDGMLIDVGKPSSTNSYYITVVSSNDKVGWENPIEEIEVNAKQDLVQKIQETILKYRQDNL
jgi:hypothetical protein